MAVVAEFQRLAARDPAWDWKRATVIAREWQCRGPVRAACELAAIPVHWANEETIPVWRLRETQRLVARLRSAGQRDRAQAKAIHTWLDRQPGNPWWALLCGAIEHYGQETNGADLPVKHCIEWLAEWGRDFLRRPAGARTDLRAHRAKGLEFDHVAVLDGAWEKVQKNEDTDAPRRLYYVAMTRARNTLVLARMDCRQWPH